MSKKDIYILMYKDYKVLSFSVDYRNYKTTLVEKLEHFDKAPYGFDDTNQDTISLKIGWFFKRLCIPEMRKDYKKIMKATHSRNGIELLFKGHGLSLSNHYWFKKENENLSYNNINFFTNKWDDSFARAVLSEDYNALSHVNLDVPDITTSGWGIKGWLYDEIKGPRLFKLGINLYEECLGEVLASRLAKRLFSDKEVLTYDLEMINGRYASSCSPMINIDEDLISLNVVLPNELHGLYHSIQNDKNIRKKFFEKLQEYGYHDYYQFFVKLACLRSMCFVNDLHFGNMSIIKNMSSGKNRIAPIYDLAGSFGTGKTAREHLAKPTKATLLLIYFMYSNLNPDWDYSWYNKDNLIGFEDEIRKILSKSDFYTPEILDFIIEIYHQQKSALDELADKKK